MGTKRLFIAALPDQATRKALVADQRAVLPQLAKGRRSATANLHLTLAFLGELDAAGETAAREAMDIAAAAAHPLTLTLTGLGTFGEGGRVVVWRGIEEDDAARDLRRIQADLTRDLAARGVATEGRPYRPHITLVRSARLAEDVAPAGLTRPDPTTLSVNAMHLMWSHHPKGAGLAYTPIAIARIP